ncbi:MAG: hypothetical protein KZQ90_00390 [Candidatus Thiodiazotropha sp. (ex Codakia rugifera)]|nr:hypothetical protein [Candidatus Thiodiazotropha sp. (ex Codakia rugifera)]
MPLSRLAYFKKQIILIFALTLCGDVYSASINEECGLTSHSSVFYKMEVKDVEEVSRYFQGFSENYFKGVESFSGIVGRRHRVETFFDTGDLQLLNNNLELSHIVDKNLPFYKEERENVFFRSGYDSHQANYRFDVKRYNKRINSLDKHPLYGRVKRKDRGMLTELIRKNVDITPETLVPNLKIDHREVVFLVTHFGKAYAEMTLDNYNIDSFGVANTSMLLKFILYPQNQDDLTIRERNELNGIFCKALYDFRNRFPNSEQLSWFGYAGYQDEAEKLLPDRLIYKKYPLLFQVGQIGILSSIGFLIIYIIVGRVHRKVVYKNTKNTFYN